ncbi:MAG: hypothetical protein OK438_03175 [Thaumarchaeota archaeon]|nr:hypothetical protein [Nitrososphaerota archaeon]
MGPDGRYMLTDDGREALRIVGTARDWDGESYHRRRPVEIRKILLASLAILLVLLAAVAGVQQLRIAQLSAQPSGLATLSGKSYWDSTLSLQGLPDNNSLTLIFHGVEFTLIPTGSGVSINPVSLNLTENGGSVMFGQTNVTVKVSNWSTFTGGGVIFYISTLYPDEDVKVTFPDGHQETMHLTTPTYDSATMTLHNVHQAFPWFSQHVGPQAAIVETNGKITLYVSADR